MASLAIALFGSNMRGMLRQRHGSSVKDEDDESDDVERPLRPRRSLSAGKQRIPGSSGSQQSQQTMLMRLAASHHQQHPSFRYVLRLSLVVSFVCCCLFPLVILVAMTVFAPVKVYLIGNGYTASGGVIGDLVDRHLVAKYRAKLHRMDSNNKLNFPDVTIKATRKTEHSHHSRYLQEILRLHYNTNATVNATTTMAVAVTYETAVQHNHRWQKHHYRSSSSSRRVKIDGANALLATNLFHSVQALRAEDCTSNWLCQRCLSTAFFGAYATCAAFCRHCYIRIISTISKVVSEDAKLVVSLTTASSGGFFSSSSKNDEQQPNLEVNRRRIPKIVHQSWLRYPRTLEYPELARLQTTWRTIGTYEYHFYTEKQQKLFIQEHYPVIVTTAYEKIPDSAHRRDFFKLLVLFKEGGVFANVDVMLETNLDALIESGTSFVAPRDDDKLLKNCLWNGFMAAEPGHAILARAIEHVLRIVMTDSREPERFILAMSSRETIEIWKLRATVPERYMYSGCFVGVAMNQVLQKGSLVQDLDLGKHSMANGGGDVLILMMSRADTGATRITDIDRNLLVASTELAGVDRRTIQQRSLFSQLDAVIDRAETIE